MTAGVSWTAEDRTALADLRLWFPDATIWVGSVTRRWFAMVPCWDRFIEAGHPADLARKLTHHQQPAAPPARGDGRWTGAAAWSTPPTPQVSRAAAPPTRFP